MSGNRWPWEAQGAVPARKEATARREHRAHRWPTIFLPLLAAGALLAAVAVWAATSAPAAGVSQAADAVLIGMMLMCMLVALPVLALLAGLVVLMARAQSRLPDATLWILRTLSTVRQTLFQVSDKTASPFIRWGAARAAWQAGWRALRQGGRK